VVCELGGDIDQSLRIHRGVGLPHWSILLGRFVGRREQWGRLLSHGECLSNVLGRGRPVGTHLRETPSKEIRA
jgi:hypothetical protein